MVIIVGTDQRIRIQCVRIFIYNYRLDPEVCRMKKAKARMKQNKGEEKERVRRNKEEHKNVGSEEK